MSTPEYLQTLHDLRNEMRRTLHLLDGRPCEPVKEIDINVEKVKKMNLMGESALSDSIIGY